MTDKIRQYYDRLQGLPLGKSVFSKLVGRMVPYTGTIKPHVEELGLGYARVRMADRRQVRNHLSSIHAIAMMNLGEVATGLALLYGLPKNTRGIVKGLSIEYFKKARGPLVAECRCEVPKNNAKKEIESEAQIRDQANEIVATVKARWLIGPQIRS